MAYKYTTWHFQANVLGRESAVFVGFGRSQSKPPPYPAALTRHVVLIPLILWYESHNQKSPAFWRFLT